MREPVGISVLTNGARLGWLKPTINALLEHCYYRPLVIGVFDNGSTDDTWQWLQAQEDSYGIKWRIERSDIDLGLGKGTNRAIEMVADTKYSIHLESDWEHMPENESGHDKMWLHRAVEFMDTGDCDYLYLRRMIDEKEMMMHFWSQWMPQITEERGDFLRCPPFWWSNNPHLRNNQALKNAGTLPLPEFENENKQSAEWTKSEMQATRPPNTWIHKWGVFIHERPTHGAYQQLRGCTKFGPFGMSTCKYGFFKNGQDRFCQTCDKDTDFRAMQIHEQRFRA